MRKCQFCIIIGDRDTIWKKIYRHGHVRRMCNNEVCFYLIVRALILKVPTEQASDEVFAKTFNG